MTGVWFIVTVALFAARTFVTCSNEDQSINQSINNLALINQSRKFATFLNVRRCFSGCVRPTTATLLSTRSYRFEIVEMHPNVSRPQADRSALGRIPALGDGWAGRTIWAPGARKAHAADREPHSGQMRRRRRRPACGRHLIGRIADRLERRRRIATDFPPNWSRLAELKNSNV